MEELYERGQRAVLLLHSYTNGPQVFKPLLQALLRHNYTVMTPTYRGHNTHDVRDVLAFNMDDFVADSYQALDRLRTLGYQVVSVGGLSIGSAITSYLLLNDPTIPSGALFSPPILGDATQSQIPTGFLKTFLLQQRLQGISEQDSVDMFNERVEPLLSQFLRDYNQWLEPLRPRLEEIKQPVFISVGGADEVIDGPLALSLPTYLPQAEYIESHYFAQGTHYLVLGQIGRLLAQKYITFLDNIQI